MAFQARNTNSQLASA